MLLLVLIPFHTTSAIYVKNKASQKAVQQYETSMKNLNTPHSHRDKFNALTEYVSFEDAMNLCLRVWDLEVRKPERSELSNELGMR